MLESLDIPIRFTADMVKPLSVRYSHIYKERKEWPELPRFKKDHITTQDVLRALLTKPKNKNEQLMKDFLNKPDIIEEALEKTTKQDFRAFLRDLLDDEKENIPDSLRKLREEEGEAEYQRALQSWAKIALPSEKSVNVDVEINQRVQMYDRLTQMYGYSKEIEYTSNKPTEIRQLESPTERLADYSQEEYSPEFDGLSISQPIMRDNEYEDFDPFADESSTYDGGDDEDEEEDHPHPVRIKITKDNKQEEQ